MSDFHFALSTPTSSHTRFRLHAAPNYVTWQVGMHSLDPIRLSLDNKAAIDSSYNPENHARTKHIDRRHYFIRELVEEGRLVVPYVQSADNLADFFILNHLSHHAFLCLETK